MHEYGLVDQLIEEFLRTPLARALPTVRAARLRYGPGLTEASVRQAFLVQSKGTKLAGARVEISRIPVEVACACGAKASPFAEEHDHPHGPGHDHDHDHDHDHEHGLPYLVCASCGAVNPIPSFNALEVTHAE